MFNGILTDLKISKLQICTKTHMNSNKYNIDWIKPLIKCWRHLISYHFLFTVYVKQSRILSSTGYQTLIPWFFFQTSIIATVGICKPVFWAMTTMIFWGKIMNYYSKTVWIWKIKINLHICVEVDICMHTHIYIK